MARPKRKGPLIPLRLSDEATEELYRRAEEAGLTPREFLVGHIEKMLLLTLDEPGLGEVPPPTKKGFERNEMSAKMEPPPQFDQPMNPGKFLETVVPLGPDSELVVPEAFQEPTDEEMAHSQEVQYGPHPSWRCNAIGMNVCTVCGEPKVSARKLCPGSPL